MKAITLARRPLIGTVAKNVLEHGSGGLNIDACRITTADNLNGGAYAENPTHREGQDVWTQNRKGDTNCFKRGGAGEYAQPEGRWPANTILAKIAVEALDKQSGIVKTGSWNRAGLAHKFYGEQSEKELNREYETWHVLEEAEGGASRYFKQVEDMNNGTIPEELKEYLTTMIDPSHITGDGGVLYFENCEVFDLSDYEDESLHGLIVEGTPSDEQVEEMNRVLKPGGHIMLVAPDEQPTGHVGACRLEDGGFEVRDSILYINSPEGFWYVPKASRSEREAGCSDLRVGRRIGNNHPTVKPYAIMQALLNTVPKDNGPVIDPFMGSGSTGIAALHTGHEFIGIEREEDYLKIADARIRHWDQSEWRGHTTNIESDLDAPEEKSEEAVDLSDLFGFGS
tara:strand:- start:8754 stop:9944 length:1191 start_codon:yes stop_codon:yes gene_type:complete